MYKKIILIALLIANQAFAKQVKFSVDMTGQTISPNGVHVYGNFQDEAGFPADWDSETTLMTKEGASNIYSVVVNIPAFRTYEYKFVNGDKSYEIEFVPEKSRVGYDFNDNRWIYIDSLNTDITVLPALLFGGNAPAGKKMIRFRVDMQNQSSIDSKGVHISGTFQLWGSKYDYLSSFGNKIYEYTTYVNPNDYIEFQYINGDTLSKVEILNGSCASANKNRYITITTDTILPEVCFASCSDCIASVQQHLKSLSFATVYPNPAKEETILKFTTGNENYKVSIRDCMGREIENYDNVSTEIPIATSSWKKGLYFISITGNNYKYTTLKLLVD